MCTATTHNVSNFPQDSNLVDHVVVFVVEVEVVVAKLLAIQSLRTGIDLHRLGKLVVSFQTASLVCAKGKAPLERTEECTTLRQGEAGCAPPSYLRMISAFWSWNSRRPNRMMSPCPQGGRAWRGRVGCGRSAQRRPRGGPAHHSNPNTLAQLPSDMAQPVDAIEAEGF